MYGKKYVALSLLSLFLGATAYAEDWPMFGRNQSRNAVSPERDPPTIWHGDRDGGKIVGEDKNILWTAPLGVGISYYGSHGDPVVVDGRVWIGTNAASEGRRSYAFLCLDEKTGKLLYRYMVPFMPFGAERWLHTMASSPLVDRDRMWFFNNRWEVVCLDLSPLQKCQGDPREVWKLDTRKELGVYRTKSIFDCRLCSVASHGDWLYVITRETGSSWKKMGR